MVEAVTVVEESTKTASSEMSLSNAANSSHNSRIENQNLLSLSSPSSALSSSALPSSALPSTTLPTSQSLSASIHHPPRRFKARPIESSAGNGLGGTAPRLVDGIYERLIRAGEPVTDPQELQFVGLLRHHVQTSTDRSTESSQNNNNFPQQQQLLQNSVENIPRRESILENVPPNGQLKQKQTVTTHAQQRQSNNSSNMDPDSTTSTDGPPVGASAPQSSVTPPPPPTITFATVPPAAPLPPPPLCPITIGIRGKRMPSVVPPPELPTPPLPIQSQQQSEQGGGQQHQQEPLPSPPPIDYNFEPNDEQQCQGGKDAVEEDDGSDIEFICEIPSGSPRPPPPPEPEPDSDSDVEFLEEVPGVVVAHVYDNIQEQQAQQLPPPEDDNLAEERLLASPPQLFPPSTTPPPAQGEDYGEFDNNDEFITINSNSSSPVYPQLDSSSAHHFDENGIPFYYDEQNVAHYYDDDDDAYYNNQQWNGGGEDLQQDDQQGQNSRETFQEDLVNDVNRNVGGNSVGVEHSSEGLISFDPSIGRPPALFPQDPHYQATISTEQSSSSPTDDVPMSPLTPMEPVGSNELASSISTEPPPPPVEHSKNKVAMCERVKEAIAVSYAAAQTQQLPPTPPVVEALQGQAAAISTQQVVVKQEDKSSTSTTVTSLPKKVASIAATASGKAPKVAQASTISTQQPVDYLSISSGVNAVGTFGSVGDCSKVSEVKDDETAPLTKSLVTPSVTSAFSDPKNVPKVDPKPSISTDYLKASISKKFSETSGKLPKTSTKSSPIDNNNVKKTKELKKKLSNNSATKLEKEKVGVKQKVKTIPNQKTKVSTKDHKKDLLKKKLTTTIEESVVENDDDDNSLDVYDFQEDLSVDAEQNFVEDEEDTEEDLGVDFMDQGSSSLNSSLTSESSLADSDSENRCDSGESDDNVDADEDAQWRQRFEANQVNKNRLPEVECPGCKSMNILRSTPEGGKSIYCTTDCVERHVRAGILSIRKWKHKYEADHAPQLLRMRYKLIERTVGGTKPECWYAKTPKEILTLINRNPCLVLLLPKSVGYFDTSAAQDSGDENVEDEEEDLNEYQQDGPITKDKKGRSIMKLKKPMKNNNKRKLKSGSKIVKQKRARSLSATEKFDLYCAAPAQKKTSNNNKSSSSRDQSVKQSGKLTRPITKKSRVLSDSSDSDDSLALPELFCESKNLDKQLSGRSNIVRSSSSSSDSDDDNEARRNLPSTSKAKNLFKSTVSNGSVATTTTAHAQPRKRNSLSNSSELNNEQQALPRVPPPPRQAVVLAGPERPRVAVAGFTSERRDGMIKRFSDLFRNRYTKDLTVEEKTRVTLEELRKLANDIENSLFEVHQKDVRKYVTHGNRIFLNANSDTNSEFFRSIFFGRFTPDRLAVMESAEMASSEKQRKAEEEKQRSLAVITQDGIDRGKEYSMMLKKTHKGEVGLGSTEGDSQDALNSTCQEFVKVVADDDGTHRKEPSACSNPSVKRVTIEPEDPLSVLKSASAPFVASPLVVDSAVIERPSSSLSSFMDDVTGPESPPPPSTAATTNSGLKEFSLKDRLPKSLAPSREASNNITKNFKIPKAKVVQQQEVITSGSPVPPPSPSHIPPPSPTRGGAHAPTGSSFPPLPSSSFPPLPTSSNFSQPPPTSSFPPPPTSACIPPSVVSLRRLSGEPILSALRSPKDSPTRTSRPKKAVQWNESNLVETKELDPNEPITVPIVLPPSTASASLSLSDTIQNDDGDGLVLSEEGAGVKALLEEIKAHKLAPDDTEKMMRKVYEYINAKEYRKLTTMLKYISKEGKLPEMKSKNKQQPKKSGSASSEKRLSSSNIPIIPITSSNSATSTSTSTTTSASEDTTPTILTESGFEIRTSATFQNNLYLPLCSTASSAPAQYSPSDISPTTTATSTVDSWIHRKRSLTPPLVDAPAPKRSSPPKFHPPPSSPTEDPVIERFNSLMSSLTAPTITTTTTSGSLVAKPFAATSINDFVSTLATSLANEVMVGSSNQPTTTITNATTSVFTTTSGPFFGSPPPVVSTLASTTTTTTATSSDTPTTTKFGHFDPLIQSASVIKSEGSSTSDSITTTTSTLPNATIDSVLSASTTTSVTNLSLGTTTISGSVFPSTTTTTTSTTGPISSSTSGSAAATTHYQIIKTGPIYKPTPGGGQNLPIRALSVASTTTTTSTTSTSAPISVKISNFRTNNSSKNNSAKQKAQQSASTLPATESWLKFQQTQQQQRQPSCYGKVSFNLKQKRSPGQVAEGTSPKEQLPKHSAFSESPPRGEDGEIVGIRSFPEVDEQKPIWRGMIKNCLLPNPKSFLVSVFPVSGRRDEAKSKDSAVFQHQLQVIRGIFPNKVWPTVKREKDEHPEDLSFVLFKPINEQNRKLYQELCDFLYAKPMFGLIDRSGLTTDSFIFPLMKDREVPVKLSVDFAGLAPPPRPHDLLLGVLICSNRYSPSDPTGTPSPSHSGSGSPGSAERLQLSTMPHSVSHTKIMNDLLDRKKREEYAKRTEYINRKYGSSTEYVKRPRPPGQNQHHYASSSFNNISPSKFPRMSSYGNQVSTSSSFMSAHAQNAIATPPPSNQVDAEIAALNQQWTGITHSTWNGPIGPSQPAPSLPTGIPRPSPAPNVSLVGGGGGGGYVGVGVQTNNTTRFPFNAANTSFNNTGRVDSTRAGAIGGGSAGYFPPQPVSPPPTKPIPPVPPQSSSSAPPFGPPYGVASNDPRVKRADEFRLQPPPIGRHPQLAAAAQSRFDPGTQQQQVRPNPTGRADDFGRGVAGWLSSGSNTSTAPASTSNNATKQ